MIDQQETVLDVVYIAFADYGITPIRRFFASYRKYAAGYPHSLLVAIKGVLSNALRDEIINLCEAAGAKQIEVSNNGFDIGTYLHMADISRADAMCLLNTNSVVLDHAWLAKLMSAWHLQGGGAVAVTGSWESLSTDELVEAKRQGIGRIRRWARFLRRWRSYPSFPNAHLRTNGIVVDRSDLINMGFSIPAIKQQAYAFESGRRSLTRQLMRQGLAIGVVGRNGISYAPENWDQSGTFWQDGQTNLLISDNQTQRYQEGDAALRLKLQRLAWKKPKAGI